MERWDFIETVGDECALWTNGERFCLTLRECSPNTTGVWRTIARSGEQLKAIAPTLLEQGHLDGSHEPAPRHG